MTIENITDIYTMLYQTMDVVGSQIKKVVTPYGLNTNEYEILKYIYRNGDQPIQKIGEEIKVTSGSMTYLIDKLEKKGFVTRRPCASDRRILYGSLSESGRELVEELIPACSLSVNNILGDFSEEDLNIAMDILSKIKNSKVTV